MHQLVAAAFVFIALHRVVSGTRLRDVITARIGEKTFLRLFTLASVLSLAWLAAAYGLARGDASARLFEPPTFVRALACIALAPAFLLIVAGLSTPNPTIVGQGRKVEHGDPARGIVRVSRHPFLWGVVLFAAAHLAVRPDAASALCFGSLLVVAWIGTTSIDRKRRRLWSAAWDDFAARTSSVPFAAIASGRQPLIWREIGATRIVIGFALYAVFAALHPWLFGVPAFAFGAP